MWILVKGGLIASRVGGARIRLAFGMPTMSISADLDEFYPGQNLSVSQLLHAAKRKLRGNTLGGRFVGLIDGQLAMY